MVSAQEPRQYTFPNEMHPLRKNKKLYSQMKTVIDKGKGDPNFKIRASAKCIVWMRI